MTTAEASVNKTVADIVSSAAHIAINPAPAVFGTTHPFFSSMTVRQFAPTEHTPAIKPYQFEPETLTRLIVWAASVALPEGAFGAELKKNLWLYGPTGCGKTRLFEAFASRTGRSLFTVNCHEDSRPSTFFGSWKLCGDSTSAIPSMRWVPGKVLQWASTPNSILLLDEADQLLPEVFMSLNAVLDGVPFIIDETGERITIAPGCMVAVAANTNGSGSAGGNGGSATLYKGTKKQNVASMDRFNVAQMTYLPEAEEIQLLQSLARVQPVIAQSMAKLATQVRAMFLGLNEDAGAGGMALKFTITTRNVLNWGMNYFLLMQMGKNSEEALYLALKITLLDFATKAEQDAVLAVLKNTVIGKA